MKKTLSRRNLLKTSAMVGTAAGFPAIIPSSVLGAAAPSNTITIGGIGTGSMGMGNLRGFLNRSDTRLLAVACFAENGLEANDALFVDQGQDGRAQVCRRLTTEARQRLDVAADLSPRTLLEEGEPKLVSYPTDYF